MIVGIALAVLAPLPHVEDGWFTDFEVASQVARHEGKAMMVNFTGSDWCGWCHKLDGDVFSKPQFKEWAQESVVPVKLDYPRGFQLPEWQRAQNVSIAEKYQVQGFPTILFMTADGEVIGQSGVLPEEGVGPWVRHARRIVEAGASKLSSLESS